MARRTRRLGAGSPADGEVAAQHPNGADAPIVPCDQSAAARGSFGALGSQPPVAQERCQSQYGTHRSSSSALVRRTEHARALFHGVCGVERACERCLAARLHGPSTSGRFECAAPFRGLGYLRVRCDLRNFGERDGSWSTRLVRLLECRCCCAALVGFFGTWARYVGGTISTLCARNRAHRRLW
jgi:hypothetical protein